RNETLGVDHATGTLGRLQVGVTVHDAAIDHRHRHTGSGPAVLAGDVGVDGGVGIVEGRGHGPVRRYVCHVGIVFEAGQRARRQRVDDTVDHFQIALQPAAPLGDI